MFPYLKFTQEEFLNDQLSPMFGNAQVFSKPGDDTPALFGENGVVKQMLGPDPDAVA